MFLGWNLKEVVTIIINCAILSAIGSLLGVWIWLAFDRTNKVHTNSKKRKRKK